MQELTQPLRGTKEEAARGSWGPIGALSLPTLWFTPRASGIRSCPPSSPQPPGGSLLGMLLLRHPAPATPALIAGAVILLPCLRGKDLLTASGSCV